MNIIKSIFGKRQAQQDVQQSGEDISGIIGTAKAAPWANSDEGTELIKTIKNTWSVDIKVLQLSDIQAQKIVQQSPMDNKFRSINGQYQIELSKNSIFVHSHGAVINLGYVKFFYQGHVYYVNVEPTVKLTTEIYNRMDNQSHMSKILIALNKDIGANRENTLVVLEGMLKQ